MESASWMQLDTVAAAAVVELNVVRVIHLKFYKAK
jgi:hypothetical protein